MAGRYNPGTIDTEKVKESIVASGGGVTVREHEDGSTHTTAYSRSEDRRVSWDTDKDGTISSVHSSKGSKHVNYKGGK